MLKYVAAQMGQDPEVFEYHRRSEGIQTLYKETQAIDTNETIARVHRARALANERAIASNELNDSVSSVGRVLGGGF